MIRANGSNEWQGPFQYVGQNWVNFKSFFIYRRPMSLETIVVPYTLYEKREATAEDWERAHKNAVKQKNKEAELRRQSRTWKTPIRPDSKTLRQQIADDLGLEDLPEPVQQP
jgi:hypothetical protein